MEVNQRKEYGGWCATTTVGPLRGKVSAATRYPAAVTETTGADAYRYGQKFWPRADGQIQRVPRGGRGRYGSAAGLDARRARLKR